MAEYDQILTETIARHFEHARIDGNEVALGVADLHIRCRVNGVQGVGTTRSASLFFHLWGGKLGGAPIFASISGYGGTAEEAIVTGGCNWACAFGPVLQAALTGDDPGEATRFETVIDGRGYVGVVDGLDRAMFRGEGGDGAECTRTARTHLGGTPWLVTRIIDSGTLPELPRDHAVILSVFCWESADRRLLEVKVNGTDWPPACRILDGHPPLPGTGTALLRELAVLVPAGEDDRAWSRARLERTLAGAAESEPPRPLAGWPGWQAHGGRLGEPASEIDLARLEARLGRLPGDYRAFLLEVQASGAGPGYGLMSPFSDAQERLGTGDFAWVDGEEPRTEPRGTLALAHAGCGVVWLLVLAGAHRGEVWVDAAGSDARARRVAPSFTAWYRRWLDDLVRGALDFSQWDADCCATRSVLSRMITSLEAEGLEGEAAIAALPGRLGAGAIRLSSGGGTYFESGDPIDPCQPCCNLADRLGLEPTAFGVGVAPKQARASRPRGLGGLVDRGPKR